MGFPTWRQALTILASGIVLAVATCGGMLANFKLEGEAPLFVVFTICFLISLLAVLVGFVLVAYRFIQDRRRPDR
jgi:tellurite resistance protein TehA-like permease